MKGADANTVKIRAIRAEQAFELLVLTDKLREMILNRPAASQIHQAAGIRSLREYGFEKVRLGATTVEEVVRNGGR